MNKSRRSRSSSIANSSNITNNVAVHNKPRSQRSLPPAQPFNHSPQPASSVVTSKPSPAVGMSPALRYQQNLKVLRRHDPSIISIFDQFSHVCLYHHNGTKWEKKGYEGSMFLFERNAYPPYGFYILNRMGMEDYVHLMYPEDDVETHSEYLMYRSYPDFTTKRQAMARPHPASLPSSNSSPEIAAPSTTPITARPTGTPSDYADAYGREPSPTDILTNWQVLLAKNPDKGRTETVGLWMFVTGSREPMKEVMKRLHLYIRKMDSYPEEFRYGPDRPPPPDSRSNGGSSTTSGTGSERANSSSSAFATSTQPLTAPIGEPSANGPAFGNNMSEVDKLFSKLVPSSTSISSSLTPITPASSGKVTLSDLFASASPLPTPASQSSNTSPPPSISTSSTKGLALLDSIFASASQQPVHDSSASPFPAPPSAPPSTKLSYAEAQFQSHYPSESSRGQSLPAQYEIHSPKPTSSALPQILTQDVISSLLGLPMQQSPTSRTSSATSSRHSGSQNRYEGDIESSDDVQSNASGAEYSESSTVFNSEDGRPSLSLPNGHHNESGHVLGDVTPRPNLIRIGGGDTTPLADRAASPRSGQFSPPSSIAASSSNSTVVGVSARPPTSSSSNPSVTNVNAIVNGNGNGAKPTPHPLIPFQSDSALWPYTRAPLDDREGSDDGDVVELDFADTSALSDMAVFDRRLKERGANGRGKGKRKGRKERERDNERERAEIERSWDVPGGVHSKPLPLPAPEPVPESRANGVKENGNGKGKEKKAVNGTSVSVNGPVDHGTARDAILTAANGKAVHTELGKVNFVREILTMINTDTAFVDSLWTEYLRRTS